MDKQIEVIATREGFFGTYRSIGERFTVPEGKMSKRWMVPADSPEADKIDRAKGEVDRDSITGERVASGGLSEQLAVALEENRDLKARVSELEAQLGNGAEVQNEPAPVQGPTPAEETVTGGEEEGARTTTTRRRRSAKK